MEKILIVEDEISICEELCEILKNSGYEADYIKTFKNIKENILAAKADLILLDINLPGVNGEMLLRDIRKESSVPVIMLTSRTTEVDEVLSMSYGADDYITKPYNPTILLLRIAAILKRVNKGCEAIYYNAAVVNLSKGTLVQEERELYFTKNEMIIFQMMLNKRNCIVTRDELMTGLWDNNEYVNDNALTVNISRLRSKLAEFGYPDAIETRKKQGYILL